MPSKIISVYFQIMLESTEYLLSYVAGMTFEDFCSDNKTFDACLMQLQHLGETAKKLRTVFPEDASLPYTEIVGMRNFIAHEYLGIDIGTIWDTLTHDIPQLQRKLERLLNQ